MHIVLHVRAPKPSKWQTHRDHEGAHTHTPAHARPASVQPAPSCGLRERQAAAANRRGRARETGGQTETKRHGERQKQNE